MYFLKKKKERKKKEKQTEGKKQEKFKKFAIKLTWIFLRNTEVIHFYNIILSDRSRGNQPGLILLSSDVLEEERIRRSLVTCGARGKISW